MLIEGIQIASFPEYPLIPGEKIYGSLEVDCELFGRQQMHSRQKTND